MTGIDIAVLGFMAWTAFATTVRAVVAVLSYKEQRRYYREKADYWRREHFDRPDADRLTDRPGN